MGNPEAPQSGAPLNGEAWPGAAWYLELPARSGAGTRRDCSIRWGSSETWPIM